MMIAYQYFSFSLVSSSFTVINFPPLDSLRIHGTAESALRILRVILIFIIIFRNPKGTHYIIWRLHRNAVIHQFSIIKDIGKNDEYFLNIDELVKVLNKSSKNRKKDKNKIEFANKLKTKYYHYYVDSNQTCYLNLTEIIKNVDHEITELYEELVDKAYKKYVKPNIIKLIEYCYKKNNIYFYTFIINQNDKNDYFEPNFHLEDFINQIFLKTINKDVLEDIMNLLKKNKYTYFLDSNTSIDTFKHK